MKNITLIFLFSIGFSNFIFSQTIANPNIPDFGMEMRFKRSSNPVSPANTGPWDYGTSSALGDIPMLISPTDPSNSVDVNYPDADFSCAGCFSQDQSYVHYLKYTDSGLKKYGGVDGVTWTNSGITLLPFPFAAGDTHTDSVTGPCCNGGSRTDDINAQALGTGNLILPDYNFNDALLVQVTRTFTDPGYYVTLESYQWWVQDYPLPVAESYTWKFNGSNIMSQGFDFMRSSTLDLNSEITQTDISIYPNPSSESLTVNWNGKITELDITIYNLKGQVVKQVENVNKGKVLNLNLNSGFYNFQIKGTDINETRSIQIIK